MANTKHQINPVISVVNVSKWFGALQVLKNMSFDVERGERVVICGPSGSGKSTMIRCLNRLETFQDGSITVNGIALNDTMRNVEHLRAEVGMVFQNFNLFPHLTVLENLILAPMTVRKTVKEEAVSVAREILKQVRIPEKEDSYPHQLSGGQQQRAAIARSLCMKPKIMLFDEPTSALDPEMVAEVLDVMIELAMSGMTMICVTHEMGFARKVANKVLFLESGEVVEQGAPEAFFTDPKSKKLKTFLGQILR